MPVGFEAWDSAGNKTISPDMSAVKFLGELSIGSSHTGSTQSGSLVNGNFALGTPFIFYTTGQWNENGYQPTVSVSGNTLSWSYPDSVARPNITFIYGVY